LPIADGEPLIVNHKPMPYLSFADRALHAVGCAIGRSIYRVTPLGRDQLPAGGFLLLPNHISWVDAVVLQIACPRPIRYIIDETIFQGRILNPVFRAVGCIPISPRRAKDGMRLAAERVAAGEIVCLFPEGQLTRSGTLLRLRRGYELIARRANAPVVPVWLDQLWGSIFSFQGGRFFTKWPRSFPYQVTVAFGKPLDPEAADIATVREQLLKLGETCYSRRDDLRRHLGRACLRGLKRRPFGTAIIDGMDGSTLNRAKLLGAAVAFARYLQRNHSGEQRIGIVLPAGKGAVVANLAVTLGGKIPVGVNFTAGRAAVESAQRQAALKTVISATPFVARLPDFPWPERVLELDKILPQLKRSIVTWMLLGLLLPGRLIARLLKLPLDGNHNEAALLFTSGSSGEPKGVVLSHRNVTGNVSQFRVMLDATKEDVMLASLPFFHSFGFTVTLWYPLIQGMPIVTFPNPLESGKIAQLIERHRITVMMATATFLRGYLRKATREQFRSVRLLIVGAEKLPLDLAGTFHERLGPIVYEGYGLTETSPVVSVNLPEPQARNARDEVQPSSRAGSVGKLAPGIAAEIRDPETDGKLSLHDSGMLWLRGTNIFEGYLNDRERTAEVLQDDWFKTGDIGRFDEDGFLFIEGRLSRFSKIGGEMVPHESVEHKIVAALELHEESERTIALVGVQDAAKGEALILLSTLDIDLATLRPKLNQLGVPNLWIPKRVRRIEKIPVLASGKLDLRGCRTLAEEGADAA
jgi:acyl-[acyl-carrier-protein]-phospholipid O-acyltransferase/long-chain-fatty-acid--[acyl-carrier-protein] ligase